MICRRSNKIDNIQEWIEIDVNRMIKTREDPTEHSERKNKMWIQKSKRQKY